MSLSALRSEGCLSIVTYSISSRHISQVSSCTSASLSAYAHSRHLLSDLNTKKTEIEDVLNEIKAEKKIAYMDNTDRIEVERKFSLAKRKFGLGLLLTKREDTTKASIVLSIIAMNIDRLAAMLLRFIHFFLNFGLSYDRLGCFLIFWP